MSFDEAYSLLIALTWFFLGSWVVLLATASVLAFTGDRIRETAKDTK
jgi:hypothetical protein